MKLQPGMPRFLVSAYGPTLFATLGYGAIIPLIPIQAGRLGASVGMAAFLVALIGVGQILADLPAGQLAQRFGERRALAGACLVDAFAISSIFLIDQLWLFGLAILVHGMCGAVFGLARMSYLTEAVPLQWRARAMSSLGGVFRIGHLLGPLISAWVTHRWTIEHGFLLGGVMCLAAAGITLLMPDLPGQASRADPQARTGLLEVLRLHRGALFTLGLGCTGVMLVRSARQTLLPLWCDHLGIGASVTSLIYAASLLVEVLLFFPGGALMDRLGRWWVTAPSLVVMSLGFMLLPLAHSVPAVAAVAVVLGLGNGFSSGIVMTLGADASPEIGRPQFLAGWRLLSDSGNSAGPLVISLVSALAGLAAASVVIGLLGWATAGWLTRWLPHQPLRRQWASRA